MCSIQNFAWALVLNRSCSSSSRVFCVTSTTRSRAAGWLRIVAGTQEGLEQLGADVEGADLGGVLGELLERHRDQGTRIGAAGGQHLQGPGIEAPDRVELLLGRVAQRVGSRPAVLGLDGD